MDIQEFISKYHNHPVLFVGTGLSLRYLKNSYEFLTTSEMMINYFQIVEESNSQLLQLLNKQTIQASQYFPIYAFSAICPNINRSYELKQQQKNKIEALIATPPMSCNGNHMDPQAVLDDPQVPRTYKTIEMICSIMSGKMDLNSVESYLKSFSDKRSTDYRKLLCAYDYKFNSVV